MQILLPSVLLYLYPEPALLDTILLLMMSSKSLPTCLSCIWLYQKLYLVRNYWIPFDRHSFDLHQFSSSLQSGSIGIYFWNLFSNKCCEIVVSESIWCTVVQEELLLMLSMIMFPKVLPGFLLTSPALTICPYTFWKSTLPSPEAGTLSSPPSLLLSLRIIFCFLSGELIFLSL